MSAATSGFVIGAALIAGAILITNHWHVMVLPTPRDQDVVRLNRWTGRMDVCTLDPSTMKAQDSFVGAEFICTPK